MHRSLGRHVSQLRSLQKSAWAGQQLGLVYALHQNGANNIWEHGKRLSAASLDCERLTKDCRGGVTGLLSSCRGMQSFGCLWQEPWLHLLGSGSFVSTLGQL